MKKKLFYSLIILVFWISIPIIYALVRDYHRQQEMDAFEIEDEKICWEIKGYYDRITELRNTSECAENSAELFDELNENSGRIHTVMLRLDEELGGFSSEGKRMDYGNISATKKYLIGKNGCMENVYQDLVGFERKMSAITETRYSIYSIKAKHQIPNYRYFKNYFFESKESTIECFRSLREIQLALTKSFLESMQIYCAEPK